MHAFITADELIRERQAGHEASLLKPEDGSERAREEDTLDGSKGDQALGKSRALVGDPMQGPVGLALDTRNGLNGIKEMITLSRVLDVRIDEKRVCLRMDILPRSVGL